MKEKERQSLILERPKVVVYDEKYSALDHKNRYFYKILGKCVEEAHKENFKKFYSYLIKSLSIK